jgi:hypothetical protein
VERFLNSIEKRIAHIPDHHRARSSILGARRPHRDLPPVAVPLITSVVSHVVGLSHFLDSPEPELSGTFRPPSLPVFWQSPGASNRPENCAGGTHCTLSSSSRSWPWHRPVIDSEPAAAILMKLASPNFARQWRSGAATPRAARGAGRG